MGGDDVGEHCTGFGEVLLVGRVTLREVREDQASRAASRASQAAWRAVRCW